MTEAKFTYRLTAELRKKLPEAVIIKLADRFTAGLPDFFITHLGVTTFFEVKLTTNRTIFEPIQLETLLKMVRGAYIIWDPEHKMGQVFWAHDRNVDVTLPAYRLLRYNPHMWFNFQELVQKILLLESEEVQ